MITNQEADILRHTSNNGRYVTDEKLVIEMGARGLLFDHGPQRLAGGMHYLVMTGKGRAALNEWQAVQPRPKIPRRRISPQFQAWRDYLEATCDRMTFPNFLKNVWPNRHHWT